MEYRYDGTENMFLKVNKEKAAACKQEKGASHQVTRDERKSFLKYKCETHQHFEKQNKNKEGKTYDFLNLHPSSNPYSFLT